MKINSDIAFTFSQEEVNGIIKDRLVEDRLINQDFELYTITKVGQSIIYVFRFEKMKCEVD